MNGGRIQTGIEARNPGMEQMIALTPASCATICGYAFPAIRDFVDRSDTICKGQLWEPRDTGKRPRIDKITSRQISLLLDILANVARSALWHRTSVQRNITFNRTPSWPSTTYPPKPLRVSSQPSRLSHSHPLSSRHGLDLDTRPNQRVPDHPHTSAEATVLDKSWRPATIITLRYTKTRSEWHCTTRQARLTL